MRVAEKRDEAEEKDSHKMGRRKQSKRRGKREPKSCPSSFQFLSVTETSQTSGSTCWHTHKHGRAHGYLDETDFTFNLIKSESEFSLGF